MPLAELAQFEWLEVVRAVVAAGALLAGDGFDARLPVVVGHTLGLVPPRVVGPPESSAESKVSQLDVTVGPNQDVVGLDVAVDEAHLVDGLDGTDELCDVEEGEVLGERAQLDEEAHHVASGDVLHHKVEVLLVLEGEEQLHYPLVVRFGQDVALRLDVGDLVPPQDIRLAQRLHGVQLLGVHFLDERHDTKGSHTQRLHHLEHVPGHLGSLESEELRLLGVEDLPHLL